MIRSIMVHRWSTSSLTPIIYMPMAWNFMKTLLDMKSFMLSYMISWRYLSNSRRTRVIFYRVFQHDKSLEHASTLTWRVIPNGTLNPLTLIKFARYHNPEGSIVMSSEYNRIPCIFSHRRISLKGYMSNNIQHMMRLYCMKSIHHFSRSNNYVLHRLIFKVVIMNSFLLNRLFFPASNILISQLNPCLNSGGLVPSALKRHFCQPLKMEQDPPSCHLVDVISQISCMISSAYKGYFQLIHFMLIWNIFMETPVVKYIHIKLGYLLATPSLILGVGSLGETRDYFFHDFGVPEHLTFDGL